MALETTRWDTADHLLTEEDRIGFLVACLEEAPDDRKFFTRALRTVARSRRKCGHKRGEGLAPTGLYKTLTGFNPAFAVVRKVVKALGYQLGVEPIQPPAAKKAPTRRPAAAKSPRPAKKSTRRAK